MDTETGKMLIMSGFTVHFELTMAYFFTRIVITMRTHVITDFSVCYIQSQVLQNVFWVLFGVQLVKTSLVPFRGCEKPLFDFSKSEIKNNGIIFKLCHKRKKSSKTLKQQTKQGEYQNAVCPIPPPRGYLCLGMLVLVPMKHFRSSKGLRACKILYWFGKLRACCPCLTLLCTITIPNTVCSLKTL